MVISDSTLSYNNYGEALKEWSNVLGVSLTGTTSNDPQSGYTKSTYGSTLVGYSAAGVGHTVPVHETIDLAWFGITGGGSSTPTSNPVTTVGTTAAPGTTAPPSSGGTVAHYGQCGG